MYVCVIELFGEKTMDCMVYSMLIFVRYFLLPGISLMYFHTVIFRQFRANEDHLQDTKLTKAMKAGRSFAKRLLFIANLFVLLPAIISVISRDNLWIGTEIRCLH